MYLVYLFASLNVIWFVCSGHSSIFFMVLGILSSLVAIMVARRMGLLKGAKVPLYLHRRFLPYSLWLVKEISTSSLRVTRLIWTRKVHLDSIMKTIPMTQVTDRGRVAYASSITMTPGTLCVNVTKNEVQVHALERAAMLSLAEGNMDRKVKKIVGKHD